MPRSGVLVVRVRHTNGASMGKLNASILRGAHSAARLLRFQRIWKIMATAPWRLAEAEVRLVGATRVIERFPSIK